MKTALKPLLFIVIIILITSNCAKKGRPNGGPKDSIAPLLVTSSPPYGSLNFKAKKIKIYFDEFITLKNVNQQLIISPPLKYYPIITPQSSPSKVITIKISDTLKPNTTYTFNFGNSIQDNNEGNKLERFKYVFSTGDYIDSLKTSGIIKDAYKQKFDKNINVLLYKIDSTYNDSIIYNQKPNYITNTLDSTLFDITNVAKGKYLLIALKDASNNFMFNPKEDKIGFYNRLIQLPKDSIINEPLVLFKEANKFKMMRPKEISKGKILFGFEGNRENIQIQLLSTVPSSFKSTQRIEQKTDTINYWYTSIDKDSLVFKITKDSYIDTVTVFLRKKKVDSLKVNSNISTAFNLKDTLTLTTNNPITKIDTSMIRFFKNDSIKVKYNLVASTTSNNIQFLFDKKYETDYKLTLQPKALLDFFNTTNDSLQYTFKTKKPEDYGSISLTIKKNISSPIFIELLSEKGEILQKTKSINNKVSFALLPPGKYLVRAIIDTNGNNLWDTGNYLQKTQPERIIYFPSILNIRSDWHLNESFTIK